MKKAARHYIADAVSDEQRAARILCGGWMPDGLPAVFVALLWVAKGRPHAARRITERMVRRRLLEGFFDVMV